MARTGLKRKDYSQYMAEQFTRNAIKMPDDLFDKWLLLVIRKRAQDGSERAKFMLLEAGDNGFPITETTREAIDRIRDELGQDTV